MTEPALASPKQRGWRYAPTSPTSGQTRRVSTEQIPTAPSGLADDAVRARAARTRFGAAESAELRGFPAPLSAAPVLTT
ncbi:MAG: hypothetical protein JWO88_3202 [Frankiales bacterium]|nr:hypothetical protein [Frankiales bacterium]